MVQISGCWNFSQLTITEAPQHRRNQFWSPALIQPHSDQPAEGLLFEELQQFGTASCLVRFRVGDRGEYADRLGVPVPLPPHHGLVQTDRLTDLPVTEPSPAAHLDQRLPDLVGRRCPRCLLDKRYSPFHSSQGQSVRRQLTGTCCCNLDVRFSRRGECLGADCFVSMAH